MNPHGVRLFHGQSWCKETRQPTRTYKAWQAMKQRCLCSTSSDYARYGARGVTVAKRWLGKNGFLRFFADMGVCPDGMTLDRVHNSRGYSPSNCRWATPIEQGNNRRTCRPVRVGTTVLTASQWSRVTGVPHATIRTRIKRGWSAENAVSLPPDRTRRIMAEPPPWAEGLPLKAEAHVSKRYCK